MSYSRFLNLLYELKNSNWYGLPTKRMKKGVFLQHSLKRWALSEIILYAREKRKNGWTDPIFIMETFCKMMDEFACYDKKDDSENTTYLFSIAYDVGMDILDMLLV